jgi:hypothetical protein
VSASTRVYFELLLTREVVVGGKRTGLDMDGLPLLRSLSTSFEELTLAKVVPSHDRVDWRSKRGKSARVAKPGVTIRAVIAQLCGINVPKELQCASCAKGNNAFSNCRISFVPGLGMRHSWACCGCAYTGAQNKCSFRM